MCLHNAFEMPACFEWISIAESSKIHCHILPGVLLAEKTCSQQSFADLICMRDIVLCMFPLQSAESEPENMFLYTALLLVCHRSLSKST